MFAGRSLEEMIGRPALAIAILIWTALTWGGRLRLLTDAEQSDLDNWTRIGGSILIGLAAALVLWLVPASGVERWVLSAFAAWSTLIWLRSLITVWTDDNSTAFKLVHTVLAAGFFALAYLAAKTGWSART